MNTKTNTETPINPLLTVEDVAKILGVCTKTIRRMVEAGDITSIRGGRQIRFSQDDLDRFIKRNRV